jgi:RNA polymerase sigma factor for flagellar operon FliA
MVQGLSNTLNEKLGNDLDIWEQYRNSSSSGLERRLIQQKLIQKYQYLVKFVIRRMNLCPPRELDYEDLISYGNMGLLDAIDRYDPSLGYAFQTYAASRIRGTILDELRRFDWISRTGREKINALEKAAEQELQESGEISNSKLRSRMGMSKNQFQEVLEIANRSHMGFLDEELNLEDSEVNKRGVLAGDLPCPDEVTENRDEVEKLYEAIEDLTEREKKLIYLYYFKYYTFSDIAKDFGLSESRISQLHKKVLDKMKNRLAKILETEI